MTTVITAAELSTSPIKRSSSRAELGDAFQRPGKMIRYGPKDAGTSHSSNVFRMQGENTVFDTTAKTNSIPSAHSFFAPTSWGSSEINPYQQTLKKSTGSRMQFRPKPAPRDRRELSNDQVAKTPESSPTRMSAQGTPPRQPKPLVNHASLSHELVFPVQVLPHAVGAPTNISPSGRRIQLIAPQQSCKSELKQQNMFSLQDEGVGMEVNRRAMHGGKGAMSRGGFRTNPVVWSQQSRGAPPKNSLHLAPHSQKLMTGWKRKQNIQQNVPQHMPQSFPQEQINRGKPPVARSTSGISPALKALQFSPALRPASPPSLALPTLRQLDDEAMLNDDDDDDDDDDMSELGGSHAQERQHQRQQLLTRYTPDTDMNSPRSSPSDSSSRGSVFNFKQAAGKNIASAKPNGLLHRALLAQHRSSRNDITPAAQGLQRSLSQDSVFCESTLNDTGSGQTIRWNFRESPRSDMARSPSLSISSVLSDSSYGEIPGTTDQNSGPSPSPVLSSSSIIHLRQHSATLRPTIPVNKIFQQTTEQQAWIPLPRSMSDSNSLAFSPVLSTALGTTPAPSESSLIDEDFEL